MEIIKDFRKDKRYSIKFISSPSGFTSSSGYDVKCNRNTTLVPTKLDFAFRANTKPCQQMPIKDVIDSAAPESYVSTHGFHLYTTRLSPFLRIRNEVEICESARMYRSNQPKN
jgi:hypothetical protein